MQVQLQTSPASIRTPWKPPSMVRVPEPAATRRIHKSPIHHADALAVLNASKFTISSTTLEAEGISVRQ